MKATNAQLAVARQSSLTYVNNLNGRTSPGSLHCTNSRRCYGTMGRSIPGYSTWSAQGLDSKTSKLLCSASHSHLALKAATQDRDYCGVTVTPAVHEILQSADEDTALLSNPDSIADAARLLLACLRHPDCDNVRRRLGQNDISFDEVQAVLTAGLTVQQNNDVCTASLPSAQTGDAPVKQAAKATTGSSMQDIVYGAMHYAVSKGSDVVQVEDLLYCLSSNRDVVCIATNPIYYAFNQMFGPDDVDKMMDIWMELLIKALVSSTKQRRLPLHVPEVSNLLLWKAIDEAKAPAGIAEVLAAFATMGWVPTVSVSTQLWGRLLATTSASLDATVAAKLLAGTATMPIPPTINRQGTEIASLLDNVIYCCIKSSTPTNSDAWGNYSSYSGSVHPSNNYVSKWLCTAEWKMVLNILACCAKLEAAFPGAITTYQISKGVVTTINMVRTEAYDMQTLDRLLKILDQTPAEAYLALTYLQRLRSGSRVSLSSPLLCPAVNFHKLSATAAFHSRLLAMCQDKQLPQSYVRGPCEQWRVLCRLPHTTWLRLLRMALVHHIDAEYFSHTYAILEMMYRQLGFKWKNSNAEVLVSRLQALELCRYDLDPPCKQWLWEDVLHTLTCTHDVKTIKSLLDLAKALELPMVGTNANTASILQQALADVELDQSGIEPYLSTITQYSQFAKAANICHEWKNDSEQSEQGQLVSENVCLHDVHVQLARHIVSTSPEFSIAAVDSSANQPPTLSKVDFLQRLLIARDDEMAVQLATKAMQAGEVRPIDLITWLCVTTFNINTGNMEVAGTGAASLLAAAVSLQALHVSDQHYTIPAVLQRWLPLASQGLSVDVYSEYCQPGSTKDAVSAVPELTTTLTSLVSFGQTDIWLGDVPCRILSDISKQTFDQQSKLLWTRFVWCLAVAWGYNQSPTTMNQLDDEQLQCLQDVLATAGEDRPVIQTLLMLTATACQLQGHLSNADNSSPPIIHQLFVASSKAATSKLAVLKTSDLKDARDNDLLHLSALALHLSHWCLPTDIHHSNVKVGLGNLLEEMERRMQEQTVAATGAQVGLIGSKLNVLVKARASHPDTAFPSNNQVFCGEIVDYIAETDRYEVELWPRDQTKQRAEQLQAATEVTTNTANCSTTSTSAIPANRNVAITNNIHGMWKPLSASSQWAAVARAIKAKL